MEKIEFGVGISMPIKPEQRARAELFFTQILGCQEVMKNTSYSCYQFPNGQVIGITPEVNTPDEKVYQHTTWLEIVSSDFNSTKERIKSFGVAEISSDDEDIYFFHVPGGAVMRLISQETALSMQP